MNRDRIAENLYQTVYRLQGPRNVLVDAEKHQQAGDVICRLFQEAGLELVVQEFRLPGVDFIFRNIEGRLGDVLRQPSVVLVAHYDTVETTFGANDNAAGIALISEVGRLLAGSGVCCSILAADLEETRSNPLIFAEEEKLLGSLGIKDEKGRYTSWFYKKLLSDLENSAGSYYASGGDQGEGFRLALEERKEDIPPGLYEGLLELSHLYDGINLVSAIGKRSRVGSDVWLKQALLENRRIEYVLAVDEPGVYYREPFTQKPISGFDFENYTDSYLLDAENRVGNFAALVSAAGSEAYASQLTAACKAENIHLPYAYAHLPFGFEDICKYVPDALGSDHAAFLREGIPAVFVFDTSNGRDPYVHTWGDTINVIDFDSLAKLTQVVARAVSGKEV